MILPPLWSIGFYLPIHCLAILILYTSFNQMRLVQMVMDITILTSTPRISNMSPSVGTEAWIIPTTQCGSSYDHWLTSWRRRLSATVCWSGSMIMRPLLMALTKATARIPQVACYYPVYLVVATSYTYRLSRSGSPANLISSPTIFLIYLHIYTGRACMGPWQQSLQRLEAKIAMKSNSQYIISVNKQYVQHTNSYGGRAYPPSYDSLAIFLAHFADTQSRLQTSFLPFECSATIAISHGYRQISFIDCP